MSRLNHHDISDQQYTRFYIYPHHPHDSLYETYHLVMNYRAAKRNYQEKSARKIPLTDSYNI